MENFSEKKFAASLSIISNALIILLKFIAGIISGSISIISEAIHSVSDFLASILTFFAVSRSSEPADKGHPFGHGKYEDMSGFIEGGLIIFAGIYIIYEAVYKIVEGYDLNSNQNIGILVMLFAVIANILVSSYLFKIAKKTDSVSLYADAQHLRTDVYSSLGVFLGLLLIKITGLSILDSIIAIIVAIAIMKTGYIISKDTLNNLLDGALPDKDIKKIEEILKQNILNGYKNLKTRKAGHNIDIELIAFFEPNLTISECHILCDKIENEIIKDFPNANVVIHAEPLTISVHKN